MKKVCIITVFVFGILLVAGALTNAVAKPSFDVKWYGFVKLDATRDQNPTNGHYAMWVNQQAGDKNDDQFNMTHKESRFGLSAKGRGYRNVKVKAALEFDLYGSGAAVDSKTTICLRHAYFTLKSGNYELLAGHTWDLISPLNPSMLNYTPLWGCGNTGYLHPQIRFSYFTRPNPQSELTFGVGFFRTLGEDLETTLSLATGEDASDGTDDGTDSGIPSVQGLLNYQFNMASGSSLRVGVSGLWDKYNAEGSLGTSETYNSTGVFGHFMWSFSSGFGFSGEYYSGTNLANYFGGILNTPATADNDITSTGGWASAWIQPSQKVKFSTGIGLDNPDDEYLTAATDKTKNMAIYGNVKYSPVPQVMLGFELSQWETEYNGSDKAKNFRAQSSFVLNF